MKQNFKYTSNITWTSGLDLVSVLCPLCPIMRLGS
jgi:hypothetical protein